MMTEIQGIESLVIDKNQSRAIIMFHGYGADAYDLASLGQMLKVDYDWYFPQGILTLPFGGRAWFPIDEKALNEAMMSHTHRDFSGGLPDGFDEAFKKVIPFILELNKKYDEIVLGGFSQGAMLATHSFLSLRVDIKKLVILSGALLDRKNWESLLKVRGDFSFLQSHGKFDPLLSFSDAQILFEMLSEVGRGKFISFSGEHEIPQPVLEELYNFLS